MLVEYNVQCAEGTTAYLQFDKLNLEAKNCDVGSVTKLVCHSVPSHAATLPLCVYTGVEITSRLMLEWGELQSSVVVI